LDETFKRVVELRKTVAPMIDKTRITPITQINTLPFSFLAGYIFIAD
jgi:hypothetical protein